MLAWVEGFAASPNATWALFAIAFAESSVFPIPPDVLLVALCLGRPEDAFVFALVCTVGSVLGGMAGYGLGYAGGRPLALKMFGATRLGRVERLYDRYNAWATGIAGLTPLPYKIFTIAGGVCAIRFGVFVVASMISRGLRFFAVAAVLYFWGEEARALLDQHLGWVSIAFVVALLGGFWLLRGVTRNGLRDGDRHEEAGEA